MSRSVLRWVCSALVMASASTAAPGFGQEPEEPGWGRRGVPAVTVEQLSGDPEKQGYRGGHLGRQIVFPATVLDAGGKDVLVRVEGMKPGLLDTARLYGHDLPETLRKGDQVTVTGLLVDQNFGVWSVWVYHTDWRPLGQAPAGKPSAEIDRIRIDDGTHDILLRADGTAEYRYRGAGTIEAPDERVGSFRAEFDRREFARLAALPGAARFDELNVPHLAFPEGITTVTVTRGAESRSLELHKSRAAPALDPDTPADVWLLEKATRGVASRLVWEPISSGVRVDLGDAGEDLRWVCVREAESHAPAAILYTRLKEVVVPVEPGRYLVQIHTVRGDEPADSREAPAAVKEGEYASVTPTPPKR